MDEDFKPVKTIRKVGNNTDKFESLSLKDISASQPAKTASRIKILDIDLDDVDTASESLSLRPAADSSHNAISAPSSHTQDHHNSRAFLSKSYLQKTAPNSLPDDALEILKAQPDNQVLAAVLRYLQCGIQGQHGFNVRLPSPKASQIINALVTITIPDHWLRLRPANPSKDDQQLKQSLLACLKSVAGIGALLMQIRQLSATKSDSANPILEDAMSILSLILARERVLDDFLSDANSLYKSETQRRVFWQEVTSLLAGSKVFATMAEVLATLRGPDIDKRTTSWLGDGPQYSKWLAVNISAAAISCSTTSHADDQQWKFLGQVLKRGLSLGYRDALITELYASLLLAAEAEWTSMHMLVQNLPIYDQKGLLDTILRDLARRFFQSSTDAVAEKESLLRNAPAVAGVAALITGLVQNNSVLQSHLIHWLTSLHGEYAVLGIDIRRSVIVILASDQARLQTILDKSLESFGNKLQIQHDPILQQESIAQTILLTIGYLHRQTHESVQRIASSGSFIRMVSNRLSASVPRVRFLGMIVAVAMSKLVDKPDKVMNFGVDEMEGEEAQRWLDLVNLQDTVGSLNDLSRTSLSAAKQGPVQSVLNSSRRKGMPAISKPPVSKVIAIQEISDSDSPASGEEDDPDLRPYARPDSDHSDSDDDPTMINRNRPTAPVYITALIKQLNATDDLPSIDIALKTAPSLIRRKANFGDELSSNVVQLASTLLNLQEGASEPEMQQLRLEALIACLVSKPALMGPWIASMYFEGDFSLAQRAVLLTAMAMGAREIGGYDDGIPHQPDSNNVTKPSFPSNRLPSHLNAVYSDTSPVNALSTTLSHRTLQPMALSAADKLTGPDILKVRTFSSRMAVAAKETAKLEARSKRIPKELHKLLADSMYLPLCSRMTLLLSAISSSRYLANSTLLHPSLLRLHLQTLVILLSTLGPNALQLPTITHESLLLLTTLHTNPSLAHDPIVLPAILHLLLTLLDFNIEAGSTAEERLVTDFGPMLAELVSWAAALGNHASIQEVSSEQGLGATIPWPVLAAGIQVKWQEVGKKFQGRMFGLMAGTDFDSF